jgi:membrane-bound lytic murein transglycosylase F
MSKYYEKGKIITTWHIHKKTLSFNYIIAYILPILFTFGFTDHNSFKDENLSLLKYDEKCLVIKDMYLSLETNKALNSAEESILKKRINDRLPKYISYFKKHTKHSIFSWELIASVAYQESHWNHKAVSFTKVKGLMMLTMDTANYIGIKNRLDPDQSVDGGVRYLENIFKRLPDSIKGSDRIWMTLAAYNVGLGHLEDARIITQKFGHNQNYWSDVKKYLPFLSKRKYYKKTMNGYARGYEPVKYVERIKSYLNIINEESKQYMRFAYFNF